jgi:hypothetical protein
VQGRSITIITAEDIVAPMKVKLKSWSQCAQQNKFDCFDNMNEYLEGSGKAVSVSIKHDITEHIRQLQNSIVLYFPPNNYDSNLLRNPFFGSFQTDDLTNKEYEQLVDIASDSVLKQKFPTVSLVFEPA